MLYKGRIDSVEANGLLFVTLTDELGVQFQTTLLKDQFGSLPSGKRLFSGALFELRTVQEESGERSVEISLSDLQIPSREAIWKAFG